MKHKTLRERWGKMIKEMQYTLFRLLFPRFHAQWLEWMPKPPKHYNCRCVMPYAVSGIGTSFSTDLRDVHCNKESEL